MGLTKMSWMDCSLLVSLEQRCGGLGIEVDGGVVSDDEGTGAFRLIVSLEGEIQAEDVTRSSMSVMSSQSIE